MATVLGAPTYYVETDNPDAIAKARHAFAQPAQKACERLADCSHKRAAAPGAGQGAASASVAKASAHAARAVLRNARLLQRPWLRLCARAASMIEPIGFPGLSLRVVI